MLVPPGDGRLRCIVRRAYRRDTLILETDFETERGEEMELVLLIPMTGFLPATGPRVLATVEAIQRELGDDQQRDEPVREPRPGRAARGSKGNLKELSWISA